MAEEVLVSVRVDRPGNQDEIKTLTGQIIAQKNEIKQLETALKNLNKAEGDNTALIRDTTKNLELKKQQLNQNTASQKALVNVINAETKSLNALKAENAQLIRQRNQINIETEEGQAAIQKINSQIDANNVKIRENSSALEKQKINIGNYASALSGVSPALGGFISQVQAATTAAITFIATPLGATLAAIALVLAPLVSFFKDTAIGADIAAREAEGFTSVMNALKDSVNAFGKEQNDIFDAIIDNIFVVSPALNALKVQYDLLAEAGRAYADELDRINDEQDFFSIEVARTENEIKRLVLQSKNRTTSEEERIALIDRALSLEASLQLKRKQFAEDELSALLRLNESRLKSVDIIQEEGETQLQFAERIAENVRNTTLSGGDELADAFINAIKKLEEVESQSIALEEKLQNQRDALLDKAEEAAKKREEQRAKEREARFKQQQEWDKEEYEYQKGLLDKARSEEQELAAAEIEQERNNAAVRKAIRDKEFKEQQDRVKQQLALTQKFAELAGGIVLNAIAGNGQLAKELAKQLASTLIDVFIRQLSAQALADSIAKFGPVAGSFRGAISVGLIQAIGNAAKGAIQGFASGGIVGDRGIAVNRSNGDNRLITAKDNEVVLTREQRARVGDDTLRKAGVPGFATGGIVGASETRLANSLAESRLDVNRMADLVNQVQVILVMQDFEAAARAKNQPIKTARVL